LIRKTIEPAIQKASRSGGVHKTLTVATLRNWRRDQLRRLN
jgi:hypothetical protein